MSTQTDRQLFMSNEMKMRSYVKAEKFAKTVLCTADQSRGGTISDIDVLNCLRKLPFAENKLRRNVIADGAGWPAFY